MLQETHICGHMKLEVTLAEVKQEKASARASEGDISSSLNISHFARRRTKIERERSGWKKGPNCMFKLVQQNDGRTRDT